MKRIILFLIAFLLIISSIIKVSEANGQPIRVFVSILPQAYFAEQIGADRVSVDVLVEPGKDPHTFDPTPRQMMALSEARLYFAIGLSFEKRIIKKVQGINQRLIIVHTDRGIDKRPLDTPGIGEHQGVDLQHKPEADHHEELHHHMEGELDPHIWLAAPEIEIQAKNIYDALIKVDPSAKDEYRRNLDRFLKELKEVHAKLLKLFKPYRGRPFFVFHPSFGYFADAYGLRQVPIEIEGKSPTPRQIEDLIKEAKRQDIQIIFVSPQFSQKSAEIIARAIGGTVIPIDPLEKNVLENLENIAVKIQRSLK
jgi:zinc transport system substrate-binding protein